LFSESEVLSKFNFNEIFEDGIDLSEIFGKEFDLKEKAVAFELEFQELFPEEISDITHTVFIVNNTDEALTSDSVDSNIVPFSIPSYAAIVVTQGWSHVGNEFEFQFAINTMFSFPPRPNQPLSSATANVSVQTAPNATIYHSILNERIGNPSYGTVHGVRVNANTMYFRFTVTLVPQSGTLVNNTAVYDILINRSGRVWNYNYTCPQRLCR